MSLRQMKSLTVLVVGLLSVGCATMNDIGGHLEEININTRARSHAVVSFAVPSPPALPVLSWLQSEESKSLPNAPINASDGLPRGLKGVSLSPFTFACFCASKLL